jgi:hypothetical protein
MPLSDSKDQPSIQAVPSPPPSHDRLALDYQTTNEQINLLTDIRFRLLAWVTPVIALAVPLVIGAASSVAPAPLSTAGLGAMGFLLTLGIVLYDRRNSMLYDAHVHRAALIERALRMDPHTKDPLPDVFGGPHALRFRNNPN